MITKLTAKKAIELSVKLWTWLAETGQQKWEWTGWKYNDGKYPYMEANCFLCEYNDRKGGNMPTDCRFCPYNIKYNFCNKYGELFFRWSRAKREINRKKYAAQLLEQLKEILKDMEAK